jgi:hypothetical protein
MVDGWPVLHYRPQMPRPRRVPYVTRRKQKRSSPGEILGALLILAVMIWAEFPQLKAALSIVAVPAEQQMQVEQSAYYSNCAEARAAGAAPISRGEPGYREGLDGDSDGVACERYRGWN